MSKSKAREWRTGYPGSGFSFYFVRCADRKSFEQYIRAQGGHALDRLGIPIGEIDGLTTCLREETLPGIIPQAGPATPGGLTHFIVDTHIIVLADDYSRKERRTWYHEIGHAVDWCAKHMAIVRHDHGVREEGHCSDGETRALLNEFLVASLSLFLDGPCDTHASSGLANAMPWMEKTEVKHG